MAEKWMQQAFANAHGQLRKSLGVSGSKTIPESKLAKAANADGLLGKRARLALNAKRANES